MSGGNPAHARTTLQSATAAAAMPNLNVIRNDYRALSCAASGIVWPATDAILQVWCAIRALREMVLQYPSARVPRWRGSAAPAKPSGITWIELAEPDVAVVTSLWPFASSRRIVSGESPRSVETRSGDHW